MFTLERDAASELWERWFSELRYSWIKVEVLQDYTGEEQSASLEAWLDGDEERALALLADEDTAWAQLTHAKADQNIQLIRFHIVDEPLTPYLKWEIEVYKRRNILLGGEKVFLINRKDMPDIVLPSGDFMIFDEARAVINTYDDTGRMTHETFYEETDDISHLLAPLAVLEANAIAVEI